MRKSVRSTIATTLAITTGLLLGGCATQASSGTTTKVQSVHATFTPDDVIVLAGVTENQPHAQLPVQVEPIVDAGIAARMPLTVIKVDGDPSVVWHLAGYSINTKNQEVEKNDSDAVQSQLLSAVQAAKATSDGSNLSTALSIAGDQATADGAKHPVIISVDSGLGDSGYPNMTTPGMTTARPADVADFGKQQKELPRIPANATVYLTGIGYGAGPQPQLTPGQRGTVSAIWQALIEKTGASVEVVPTPRTGAAPKTTHKAGIVKPATIVQFKVHRTADGLDASLDSDLLFEPDRWSLIPSARVALDQLAALLKRTPGVITVKGFTDIGTTSVPGGLTALSQYRADAVKAYLVRQGLHAGRIVAKGEGSGGAMTVSPANRRVLVLVTKGASA